MDSTTTTTTETDGFLEPIEGAGPPKENIVEQLTNGAAAVVREHPELDYGDMVALLSERVTAWVSQQLLMKHIRSAYAEAYGKKEPPLRGGDTVKLVPTPWTIPGLVQHRSLNMWAAEEKVGKTTMLLSLAAAALWLESFAGQPVRVRPTGLIVIGSDMDADHWTRSLRVAGLATGSGDTATLVPEVREVWHRGTGWRADPDGLRALDDVCCRWPGSLVLIDSLAAITTGLDFDENSTSIVDPLLRIAAATGAHDCTPVVVHHLSKVAGANKVVGGQAFRGSTGITAAVDWMVQLQLMSEDHSDTRRRTWSKGRDSEGGNALDLVVEWDREQGVYRRSGTYREVNQAAQLGQNLNSLGSTQDLLKELLAGHLEPLTTAEVLEQLGEDAPSRQRVSDALAGMQKKGLLVVAKGVGGVKRWALAPAARVLLT